MEKDKRITRSGIPIKEVYEPTDVKDIDYNLTINSPGYYPYTRGISGVSGRRWIQRELSGEGDPHKSNAQLKYLIGKGQNGIDVIGDSPSAAYMDPDHPMAYNAVGNQGVSICCLQDYRDLWEGIPLDSITISNSLPAIFAVVSLYLVARERGIPSDKLRGSVIQSPLYMEHCGYASHMPFELRLRLTSDCIEFCSTEMPRFHSFVEDTYFFSEAGLNGIEEMALGFIEIRCIIKELLKRGLKIDEFAPRIAILVNCTMDFFEEIAKIRATRRMFAKMMREEFGAKNPRSLAVVITSHTSGLTLTAQQPVNNIVRGTIQSLSLVLSGAQAIEISTFDEAFRTPSPEAHLVGLRTQQIIDLETNVSKVTDPLGGSYYLENLTSEMENKIWQMVLDIESKGTYSELSGKGWFKTFFENCSARYNRQLDKSEVLKVGVNCHQLPDEEDTLLKKIAEIKIEPTWSRVKQIKNYKENRDQNKVKAALKECYDTAKSGDSNLIYPILNASGIGATMGEITGVLRLAYEYPYDPFNFLEAPI